MWNCLGQSLKFGVKSMISDPVVGVAARETCGRHSLMDPFPQSVRRLI